MPVFIFFVFVRIYVLHIRIWAYLRICKHYRKANENTNNSKYKYINTGNKNTGIVYVIYLKHISQTYEHEYVIMEYVNTENKNTGIVYVIYLKHISQTYEHEYINTEYENMNIKMGMRKFQPTPQQGRTPPTVSRWPGFMFCLNAAGRFELTHCPSGCVGAGVGGKRQLLRGAVAPTS